MGDGWLDANPAWGVLVASPTVVRLPIEMDQQYNLSLDYGPAQFGGLLPYVPWPASDYNDDGQLDETSDYAAFLVGWSAHEALADINVDENFDQDDIDLWWSQFQEDVAHE